MRVYCNCMLCIAFYVLLYCIVLYRIGVVLLGALRTLFLIFMSFVLALLRLVSLMLARSVEFSMIAIFALMAFVIGSYMVVIHRWLPLRRNLFFDSVGSALAVN